MKECRKGRQKRLIEVYDHLRQHFGIHTKTGFAEAVKYGRTSMSAALNGKEEYLTDDLFENICEEYPVFNIDYLLTGEGELLNDKAVTQTEKAANPTVVEQAANIIDLYAGLIKEIESLRTDLNAELAAARQEREEAHRLITALHDCLFHARTITGPHIEEIPMAAESNENKPNVSPNNSPK
jgi:hypothetical protein